MTMTVIVLDERTNKVQLKVVSKEDELFTEHGYDQKSIKYMIIDDPYRSFVGFYDDLDVVKRLHISDEFYKNTMKMLDTKI